MFLLEPNRTAWDLNFYIGPIHVRVHPFFWLMAAIVSGVGSGISGVNILIGVAIVFVSILVHELGHAVVMRRFGEPSRIVLYAMGGFATNQSEAIWENSGYRARQRTAMEQIIVSAAGPAAGFLLALLVVVLVFVIGGSVHFYLNRWYLPAWDINSPAGMNFSFSAWFTIEILLFCNIYWGLMNLLPVYPLDGGQIARPVLTMIDPYKGPLNSLWLSVITGAAVAVLGLMSGSIFLALMFGSLAFSSWQALQMYGGGGRRF